MKAFYLPILLLMGLATSVQAAATTAPAPATRPSGVIAPENCTISGCHANVKQYKVLHGPVNVNACDTCHKPKDIQAHTYTLTRTGGELCTFCHQINTMGAAVVHKPVAEGQCTSCHNPHGGSSKPMTRGVTTRDLCVTCHKDVAADKRFVHGPVAAGSCESCHTGHSSKYPKLINTQGNQVCFDCHRDMKTQMANAKFKHKAVEGNCMDCHDPHASNFTMQTRSAPFQLCTKCHDKIGTLAKDSKYQHSIVSTDQACLNCHTAHGGQLASLMRKEPVKLCMGCHGKSQTAPDGRKVNSVAEVNDPKKIKHGPIMNGECSGCHTPHGSDNAKLLAKEYPGSFYQAFDLSKYGLCFSCHDKQLVLNKEAKGLTNFRNGDENLHFVHVNREKGRNCRSCHNTHASSNPLHLRDSVPFGNWELPIKYSKTATGGSCAPGCHKAVQYDREQPLTYDIAPAATQPSKE